MHLTLSFLQVRKSYKSSLLLFRNYWSKVGVTLDVQVEDSAVWNTDWAAGNLRLLPLLGIHCLPMVIAPVHLLLQHQRCKESLPSTTIQV